MIQTKQEKAFVGVAHIVFIVMTIFAIAPFVLLISGSFTDDGAALRYGYRFWPTVFSVDAYRYLFFQWEMIGRAYAITIFVTVVGTTVSLIMASTLGYALAQRGVPGVRIITLLVVLTLLFNGGIVSTVMVYTHIFNIRNTIWALIVPNLMLSGFTVILVKNYIQSNIPPELIEAAVADGAGQMRIYWRIALPLSRPILATIGLLGAIAYWNDWVNGLYFITDPQLLSIQLLLNRINTNIRFLATHPDLAGGMDLPTISVRMAIAAVAIIPIVVTYPFFQKHFTAGIALGGVKG